LHHTFSTSCVNKQLSLVNMGHCPPSILHRVLNRLIQVM